MPEDRKAMRDNVYLNKNISKSLKCNLEDISCHCGEFLSKSLLENSLTQISMPKVLLFF